MHMRIGLSLCVLSIAFPSPARAEAGSITFLTSPPLRPEIGDTYRPKATSNSPLPVLITAWDSCSYENGVVTFNDLGNCHITTSHTGDWDNPITLGPSQTFTIVKRAQTVVFTSPPPASARVGEIFTPTGYSTSGLEVLFDTNFTCTLMQDFVNILFLSEGNCIITIRQYGTYVWEYVDLDMVIPVGPAADTHETTDANANDDTDPPAETETTQPALAETEEQPAPQPHQPVIHAVQAEAAPSITAQYHPVTLIARASPAADDGTISFMEGTKTICEGLTPRSGTADCVVTFETNGPRTVTAHYTPESSATAITSNPITITISAAAAAPPPPVDISHFLQHRNNQLLSNNPLRQRSFVRAAPEPATEPTNGSFFETSPAVETAQPFLFTYSLREHAQRRPQHEALNRSGVASFSKNTHSPHTQDLSYDAWLSAGGNTFKTERGKSNHAFQVAAGADISLTPSFVLGFYTVADSVRTIERTGQTTSGYGYVAGPYISAQLTPSLQWHANAAYGHSSNEFSTPADFGEFTTTRWTAETRLTGTFNTGAWTISPEVAIAHSSETSDPFTSNAGASTKATRSTMTQAQAGPRVAYSLRFPSGSHAQPFAGINVLWTSTNNTGGHQPTPRPSDTFGQGGLRGRADIGLLYAAKSGLTWSLAGHYDGLGTAGYSALNINGNITIPLN